MTTHSARIVPFTPITYTREEKNKILDYFKVLKSDYIKDFLGQRGFRRTGNKDELLDDIRAYIQQNQIQYSDLVNYLDSRIPYNKQHVFLYNGPEQEINRWRRVEYVRQTLDDNDRLQYLNQKLPLILPLHLSLSSIDYHPGRDLQVLAIQRRDYVERYQELDVERNNEDIELHAYKHQVHRGLIIFYWNLVSNQARLQITQLPSRGSYEEIENEFAQLVYPWLPFNLFQKLNLRPVITRLRDLEAAETPEARSQDISLDTIGGRRISVKSPTSQDSTIGEDIVDEAVQHVSNIVVGHLGNFYWLPQTESLRAGNILDDEVHTIIVGNKGRINFMTPNSKEDFEYVLSRVRSMC